MPARPVDATQALNLSKLRGLTWSFVYSPKSRHPRIEARTMCNLYSITTNQAAIMALFG
jgi:hypothetical protein